MLTSWYTNSNLPPLDGVSVKKTNIKKKISRYHNKDERQQ